MLRVTVWKYYNIFKELYGRGYFAVGQVALNTEPEYLQLSFSLHVECRAQEWEEFLVVNLAWLTGIQELRGHNTL